MKTKILTIALAALTIGLLASCDIWPKGPHTTPVTGVTLDKTELTLTVGDPDVKLTATVAPENATDTTVSWASDKPAVATVDQSGNVHAVAAGTATITATTTDGGKTATCDVTVKAALPAGALAGEFTIDASGKKVHFSQGNLTYNVSTTTWAFYEHQYDCATGYEANLISLFTWGYDAAKSIEPNGMSYVEGHTTDGESFDSTEDWGTQIGDGNTWRTLTTAEWQYLFNIRTVNGGTGEGKSYQRATINSDETGVYGMILYPDNYTGTAKASYTSTEWESLENAGCVFLPAAGYRDGSYVGDVGGSGYYWSSTASGSNKAYSVYFRSNDVDLDYSDDRNYGDGIRLITDVK